MWLCGGEVTFCGLLRHIHIKAEENPFKFSNGMELPCSQQSGGESGEAAPVTSRRQGCYWIATVPHDDWQPAIPQGADYIIGQSEIGRGETGYRHWQFLVHFPTKISLRQLKSVLPGRGHYELTRSDAARVYVTKADTRVDGTEFELGQLPFRRNVAKDWEAIWMAAKSGRFDDIPADIRVNSYRNLRAISTDFLVALPIEKLVKVYWGVTGSGKSRAAWGEAGFDAFPKDPRSKFWCGYQGQKNVVIDEFRGGIDIGHLLRWLDRYPVIVEVKGGAQAFRAENVWITSNLNPNDWYPELDVDTLAALRRRLAITHFQ